MAAINFPANPADGDEHLVGDKAYTYNATKGYWTVVYSGMPGSATIDNFADVDTTSTPPTNGQALVWDGNDWVPGNVAASGGGGSTTDAILPVAFGFVDDTANGSGTGISWANWDAANSRLEFTFDTAQADANYAVITDSDTFDDYFVGVTNKTTTGFRAEFYDSSQSRTPSSFSPFTFVVYASNPVTAIGSGGGASIEISDTAPTAPTAGDLWFDSTELTTYVYYNDGTSNQWVNVTPTTSGGGGSSGGGSTTYTTATEMVAATASAGDFAYVTDTNKLYVYTGAGWSLVTTTNTAPTITSVQDASNNTQPFTLATDGTATVITVTATDPEGLPLDYTYSVTGTLGNTATISQNGNVFTVTPSTTESDAGTFTLVFTASDGINTDTSANSFELVFITTVTDSKYTSLLLQTDSTAPVLQADASSNSHTLVSQGNSRATAFSPYHPKGYSAYFDGTGDALEIPYNSGFALDGDFTIETWIYHISHSGNYTGIIANANDNVSIGPTSGFILSFYSTTNRLAFQTGSGLDLTTTNAIPTHTWTHLAVVRSGSDVRLYINGVAEVNGSTLATFDAGSSYNLYLARGRQTSSIPYVNCYLTDTRIVKGTAVYTSNFTPPTERLTAIAGTSLLACHLPYFKDGSSNDHSITVAGNTETRISGPYDHSPYTKSDHRGTVYFDGAGDYWQCADNFSTFFDNPWTIEFWAYTESLSSSNAISIGDGSGVDGMYLLHGGNGFYLSSNGSNWNISGYTSSTIRTNTWHHCAVSWDGSDYRTFIDGKLENTATSSDKLGPGPYTLSIGATYNGTQPTTGHLSDVRMTKSALYTADFTPPTEPLAVTADTELLTMTNNTTVWDMASGNTVNSFGNSPTSNVQTKYASSNLVFDGSQYTAISRSLHGDFGTGDFTVEAWVYLNESIGNNRAIFGSGTSDTNDEFSLLLLSNGALYFDWGNTSTEYVQQGSPTFTANTWHHVAVTRSGTQLDVWLDGTSVASNSSHSFNYAGTSTFKIGMARNSAIYWTGYIEDVRVTTGLSRYTASFTPPTGSLEG